MADKFTVTVTPDRCPECGSLLECSWTAVGNVMEPPVPGDWTVCSGCAAPLRFNADLRVRATTIAERSGPEAPSDLMAVVKAAKTLGRPATGVSVEDNAKLLITSIDGALANGVVHRNRAGKVLTTTKEILACLLNEGVIECEEVPKP